MHNKSRNILVDLIKQHGLSLCDDPILLRNTLLDKCGEYRREIHLLVSALQERVPQDLLLPSSIPLEVLLSRLTLRLQDHLAVTAEAARWVVESWGLALDMINESQAYPLGIDSKPETTQKPEETAGGKTSLSTTPVKPGKFPYKLAISSILGISILFIIYQYNSGPKFPAPPPKLENSSTPQTQPKVEQETAKKLKDEFLRFAGLGDELRKKGDFVQAIRHYNKAIELIPDFSDWIYNNRGLAYLNLGEYNTALQDFDRAIALNPASGYSYNNRAVAYHGMNNFQHAQNDLLQAKKLGHRVNPELFQKVSRELERSRQGPDSKSDRVSPPATIYNPALAKALCEEGRLLYKQGKFAESIEKLELSIQHDSSNSFAHYLLGWSYHQLERSPELALASFQTAIRLKPNYSLAYDGMAWTYNKLERYKEALQAGKKAVQIIYNFPDAQYNLGIAYLGLGNKDMAMKQFQILQKMNKDKAELLLKNILAREGSQTRTP